MVCTARNEGGVQCRCWSCRTGGEWDAEYDGERGGGCEEGGCRDGVVCEEGDGEWGEGVREGTDGGSVESLSGWRRVNGICIGSFDTYVARTSETESRDSAFGGEKFRLHSSCQQLFPRPVTTAQHSSRPAQPNVPTQYTQRARPVAREKKRTESAQLVRFFVSCSFECGGSVRRLS
jgi:hypothetical protein